MAARAAAVVVKANDANIIHRVWETLYSPMTTAWEAAGGNLSWTNCEIVHVSRSFGQGDRGEKGVLGEEEEGAGGWWSWQLLGGGSCKFTHWAAFCRLRLLPALKNGTKCVSLWNSLVAYRWRSYAPLLQFMCCLEELSRSRYLKQGERRKELRQHNSGWCSAADLTAIKIHTAVQRAAVDQRSERRPEIVFSPQGHTLDPFTAE